MKTLPKKWRSAAFGVFLVRKETLGCPVGSKLGSMLSYNLLINGVD